MTGKRFGHFDDTRAHGLAKLSPKDQFPGNQCTCLMDISCTEGNDHISFPERGCCCTSRLQYRSGARDSLMAFGTGCLHHAPLIDSRDGGFAGGIDGGNKDKVGISKGPSEFGFEGSCAGITMRLEENHETALSSNFSFLPGVTEGDLCRRKRCRNFGGMMAVIVEDSELIVLVLELKAALRSSEGFQRGGDDGKGNSQVSRQRNHQKGVLGIMQTGNPKMDATEQFPFTENREADRESRLFHLRELIMAVRSIPHRDSPRVRGTDTRGSGVIGPVVDFSGSLTKELGKNCIDRGEIPVVVEMLGFDVEHQRVTRVVMD